MARESFSIMQQMKPVSQNTMDHIMRKNLEEFVVALGEFVENGGSIDGGHKYFKGLFCSRLEGDLVGMPNERSQRSYFYIYLVFESKKNRSSCTIHYHSPTFLFLRQHGGNECQKMGFLRHYRTILR